MAPQAADHKAPASEPLDGATLMKHGLVKGSCPLLLGWGDMRPEGPTVVGKRAQAESKQAGARERDLPLLQDADWLLGSSWYVYITGREQMGWKLNCVGRGQERGTFRPHSVGAHSVRSCPTVR